MAEQHSKPTRRDFIDISGRAFGRLTVLYYVGRKAGQSMWECQCKCGRKSVVTGSNLRKGVTRSCGCLGLEAKSKNGRANVTHGMTQSAEFGIWRGMIKRCTVPTDSGYHRYGGRGIRVCEQWLNSFQAFWNDVGPRPSVAHSIDRYPNNNGNYEPGNVRWATDKQQMRNMRTNRIISFDGKSLTMVEWAELLGLKPTTLKRRIHKGWSLEKALQPRLRNWTRRSQCRASA